jgi:hypothetical protein
MPGFGVNLLGGENASENLTFLGNLTATGYFSRHYLMLPKLLKDILLRFMFRRHLAAGTLIA